MPARNAKERVVTPFARRTARILFEIEAVLFNSEKPFIFTSGWASPVYIDCRKILSYPRARTELMKMAEETILNEIGCESLESVAGGETAGIPFAAWIADRLSLPMQYIRKQPKGFGRMAQIEGKLEEGARTLLVEDLATDGKSKVKFCEALRNAGAQVDHAFVIFHYGIFPQSLATMKSLNVELHALATWWDALAVAKEMKYFDNDTLDEVEAFLNSPAEWSEAHGGASGKE